MTYEKIKEIIQNEIPFHIIEKNKGIYEFEIGDDIILGISYEDLNYFDDFVLNDVYIFNLFLGDEYINVSGAYRKNENNFICIDAIKTNEIKPNCIEVEVEQDVFEEILNSLNF